MCTKNFQKRESAVLAEEAECPLAMNLRKTCLFRMKTISTGREYSNLLLQIVG